MPKKTPPEVLKAAREVLKKTQAEMAEKLGVTQPMIARWESGGAHVPTERVRAVASVYGVKPEQLLPDASAA